MAPASRDFQVFAKPIGALCNLECAYCYYLLSQPPNSSGAPPRMPERLLEEYIVQHVEAAPGRLVSFSWHGGEPTLLGLDYFRTIVALQEKHRPPGGRVVNGIQTNGLLIDEQWCRFLAETSFSVGLSLDGPADLHDCYRVARGGQPTHRQVVRAFRLLRRHRVNCDLLCVVHAKNVGHPAAVYRFFRDLGATSIGLLPLVERDAAEPGGVSARSVPPEAYGRFLCQVFDEWQREDAGRIVVQLFDEASRAARGLEPTLCVFRQTCGDVPVVEHDGGFYSCDHFVNQAHRVGNIRQTRLADLIDSPQQRAFGQAKLDSLPRECRVCEVRAMCNGGCPKDRFARTSDGEGGLNYLCPGLKMFFSHSLPRFRGVIGPDPGR